MCPPTDGMASLSSEIVHKSPLPPPGSLFEETALGAVCRFSLLETLRVKKKKTATSVDVSRQGNLGSKTLGFNSNTHGAVSFPHCLRANLKILCNWLVEKNWDTETRGREMSHLYNRAAASESTKALLGRGLKHLCKSLPWWEREKDSNSCPKYKFYCV